MHNKRYVVVLWPSSPDSSYHSFTTSTELDNFVTWIRTHKGGKDIPYDTSEITIDENITNSDHSMFGDEL